MYSSHRSLTVTGSETRAPFVTEPRVSTSGTQHCYERAVFRSLLSYFPPPVAVVSS
jgi:hypothetical protein